MLSDVEEIYCDRSILMDGLPDNLRLLRPDIVVWHNNRNKCTLKLVFLTLIPIGVMTH